MVILSPIVISLMKGRAIDELIEKNNKNNAILLNKFKVFN